jgi:hypothetical protein
MFGWFRGKDITRSLDMIPAISVRKSRKNSFYIYRIASLPFRKQSAVVTIRTIPTGENGKHCRRTNRCVWNGTWASVGSDRPHRATLGGLPSEDAALSAALENACLHYRKAWGRETRSLSLPETRHTQVVRLPARHLPRRRHALRMRLEQCNVAIFHRYRWRCPSCVNVKRRRLQCAKTAGLTKHLASMLFVDAVADDSALADLNERALVQLGLRMDSREEPFLTKDHRVLA